MFHDISGRYRSWELTERPVALRAARSVPSEEEALGPRSLETKRAVLKENESAAYLSQAGLSLKKRAKTARDVVHLKVYYTPSPGRSATALIYLGFLVGGTGFEPVTPAV